MMYYVMYVTVILNREKERGCGRMESGEGWMMVGEEEEQNPKKKRSFYLNWRLCQTEKEWADRRINKSGICTGFLRGITLEGKNISY